MQSQSVDMKAAEEALTTRLAQARSFHVYPSKCIYIGKLSLVQDGQMSRYLHTIVMVMCRRVVMR